MENVDTVSTVLDVCQFLVYAIMVQMLYHRYRTLFINRANYDIYIYIYIYIYICSITHK